MYGADCTALLPGHWPAGRRVRAVGEKRIPLVTRPGRGRLSWLAVSVKRRVKFQTAVTALSGLFVYGLSAVTGPLLARSLGPSGRGDLAAVQVPSQLFGYLLCFGLPMASLYYASQHTHRELMMSSWVFAVVVGGGTILAVWWLIPSYLQGHDHQTIIWLRVMLVAMVAFVPANVAIDLLRTRASMASFNVMRAFPLVFNTVLIVGLALAGRLDLTTALAALLVSQVTWFIIALSFSRAWPQGGFRRRIFLLQLSYGSRSAIGSLSEMVVARLDQFLLVAIVDARQLGLYAVSATAAGLSGPAAFGVALVLFPRIRETTDPREAWRVTKQAMRWTLLSSSCFAALLAISAPTVLPLLFGHDFRGAVSPLWLLLPGQVAFDLANVLSQKAMADNRPGAVSRAYSLAALVTVAGLFAFVKSFGIDAAAVVTSVSQGCYLAYLWFIVKRDLPSAPAPAPAPEHDAGPDPSGIAPSAK
jgi:O-antigen/teichoic acid export membrane protein